MKLKKVLSVILAVSMTLSVSVPAYGAVDESGSMESALRKVKEVIDVPAEYDEFDFSYDEYEYDGDKTNLWSFSWYSSSGDKGSMNASATDAGLLWSYYRYDYTNDYYGLANYNREQCMATARSFVEKAAAPYGGELKADDLSLSSYGDNYDYTFRLYVNGVPTFMSFGVSVNKYNNTVTSYNSPNPSVKITSYGSSEAGVSVDEAKKSYMDEYGIVLKYYSSYDYDEEKINVFPAYSRGDGTYDAIDAATGKPVTLYRYDEYYYGGAGATANDSAKSMGLSREEMNAIEKVSGLISQQEAEAVIRKYAAPLSKDAVVNSASLNKNYMEKTKYIWVLSFDGGYGSVDAVTGELLSFYCYSEVEKNGERLDREQLVKVSEDFVKSVTSSKAEQVRFDESEDREYAVYRDDEDYTGRYNFVRVVNGIDFPANGMTLTVNETTGQVLSYSSTWYDSVTFAPITGVMSPESAFDIIDSIESFGLQYGRTGKHEAGLIYTFTENSGQCIIDPFNGKRLSGDGTVYTKSGLPAYEDIKGHDCEKTVRELMENGYWLDRESFAPDKAVSSLDFLRYMYKYSYDNYSTDDSFIDMLVRNKIVEKGDKTLNASITRYKAAQYVVKFLRYDAVANIEGIYLNNFADDIPSEYAGYVAICAGLGIFKSGPDISFDGAATVTAAQAADIIYSLLSTGIRPGR